MLRRKRSERKQNHERWVVSYADFITLLFAFFVVMYAISAVNISKYKAIATNLEGQFGEAEVLSDPKLQGEVQDLVKKVENPGELDSEEAQANTSLSEIADDVKKTFSDLINEGLLNVRQDSDRLEIELKSEILFASGGARISPVAEEMLEKMGKIVGKFENTIQVEGFTDNKPISNEYFPSNWELSAARSASVVRAFIGSGVKPERLVAIGYADQYPVSSNETEIGRHNNRRVVLVVSKQQLRHGKRDDKVAKVKESISDAFKRRLKAGGHLDDDKDKNNK